MTTRDYFANRLLELREKSGITQQQLADAIGVTRQSLSLYEAGERTANIELLERICKYFNVSADYLIGLSDVSSFDIDKQAVSRYLGISEKSIESIIKSTSNTSNQDNFQRITNKFLEKHLRTVISMLEELDYSSMEILRTPIPESVNKITDLEERREWLKTMSADKELARYRFSLYAERINDDFDHLEKWAHNEIIEDIDNG